MSELPACYRLDIASLVALMRKQAKNLDTPMMRQRVIDATEGLLDAESWLLCDRCERRAFTDEVPGEGLMCGECAAGYRVCEGCARYHWWTDTCCPELAARGE